MRGINHVRVFCRELTRCLDVRYVLVALAAAVMIFFTFMEYYSDFTHSHPSFEESEITREMTELYGNELDEAEFADFMKWRDGYIAECERWIQTDPWFAKVGILSYDDYVRIRYTANPTEEESRAFWRLLGEQCDYAQFYVEAHESICERYETALEYVSDADLIPTKDDVRYDEQNKAMYATGEYMSIVPSILTNNFDRYAMWLAVVCLVSVMLLVCPVVVTDRMTGVDVLQRSARHGRKITLTQLFASASVAIIVAAVEMAAFIAVFLIRTNTSVFLNHRLNSFLSWNLYRSNITFGGHIFSTCAVIMLLSIAASITAYVLSSVSRSIVGALLKIIPAFAVLVFIAAKSVPEHDSFSNELYRLTGVVCAPLLLALLMLCISGVAGIWIYRREKLQDY